MAAGWATLRPSTLTVPAHSEEPVEVEIHPPRLPTTAAGPTSLTVRVATQRPDVEVLETSITLDVQAVRDRRLALLQPAQRGRLGATYELTLENRGNVQASCRMRLVDPTGRLEADFEPPAAGVEPGRHGAGARPCAHHAARSGSAGDGRWRSASRPSSRARPPSAPAARWCRRRCSRNGSARWITGIVGVLALLTAGWFAVVKPADPRRGRRRRRRADPVVATPTTVVDAPFATTIAPPTTVAVDPPTTTAPPTTTPTTTATTIGARGRHAVHRAPRPAGGPRQVR